MLHKVLSCLSGTSALKNQRQKSSEKFFASKEPRKSAHVRRCCGIWGGEKIMCYACFAERRGTKPNRTAAR